MSDEREQIAEVLPREPRRVTVSGQEIVIRPVTVGQLPAVLDILEAMQKDLGDVKGIPGLPLLLRRAYGPLVAFTALVTGEPQEWVTGLNLADGARLFGAVLEENASFFVESLLPAVNEMMPGVMQMAALWAGLKSSPGSSETDTGPETSTDTR